MCGSSGAASLGPAAHSNRCEEAAAALWGWRVRAGLSRLGMAWLWNGALWTHPPRAMTHGLKDTSPAALYLDVGLACTGEGLTGRGGEEAWKWMWGAGAGDKAPQPRWG